jgi:hypothetical protein
MTRQTPKRPKCGACGARLSQLVHDMTRRLLGSLDPGRQATLAEMYQGKPPRQLCAECFLATAGALNNSARHAEATA